MWVLVGILLLVIWVLIVAFNNVHNQLERASIVRQLDKEYYEKKLKESPLQINKDLEMARIAARVNKRYYEKKLKEISLQIKSSKL